MSKEHYYDIIKSPAVTEKGTLVSEKNQVVFNVARDATKPEIKKAVEGLFGVKVKAVNTLVRIRLDGEPGAGEVIASGHDFYSTPRLSPDGARLCWLAWRHPQMPWDGTDQRAAELAKRSIKKQAKVWALELALRGPARGVNPQVGAVILDRNLNIISEGWHEGSGTPHAEVDALSRAGDRARGATAVVTLEPCNHTGRTGPCAQALIAAGVRRVVIAQRDGAPILTSVTTDEQGRFSFPRTHLQPGRYTVRVSDLQYMASPEHFFRVSVGELPVVTGVFPLAVPANLRRLRSPNHCVNWVSRSGG